MVNTGHIYTPGDVAVSDAFGRQEELNNICANHGVDPTVYQKNPEDFPHITKDIQFLLEESKLGCTESVADKTE